VTLGRALDRLVVWLAAFACLVFCLGLVDVRLAPPKVRETARRRPDAGELLVRVARLEPSSAPPVARASVRAYARHGDDYELVGEAETGSDGRATLQSLPRGATWLVAEAAGLGRSSAQIIMEAAPRKVEMVLAPAHRLVVRVEDEQGTALEKATVLVESADPLPFGGLTGSEGKATLDRLGPSPWTVRAAAAGYESVTRSGVDHDVTLSLRRLGALTVHVRDPSGNVAPLATVFIVGSQLWPARRVETDGQGSARITGLLGGGYDLKATKGTLASEVLVGFPLERGRDAEVTLELVVGHMVTVLVVDAGTADRHAVPGADVALSEAGLSSFPLRGRTGPDGRVTLGPIAPGPATVAVRAADFVARPAVPVPEPLEGVMEVALLRAATLKGEVVDARGRPVDGASIEVVGTDLEGLPIAETPQLMAFSRAHFAWSLGGPAPLLAAGELGVMPGPVPPIPRPWETPVGTASPSPAELGDAPVMSQSWTTGLDGRFVAHPVTPGRVRALVRHPAYVEGVSDPVSVGPGGEASVRVVMRPGGALEGRVVDDRHYPVSGARVDVLGLGAGSERATITASDGSFAFASLPGEVVVSVARPEDLARVVVRHRVAVQEGSRTRVEIELPPPRKEVRIVVRDDRSRPVEGAQVTVASLDPEYVLRKTLFTAGSGEVTVPDARGLRLEVAVQSTSCPRVTRTFGQAPESIEVVLEAGVIVTGRVTTVRGRRGVDGATVMVAFGGERRQATTNQEGNYRILEIPPGPVKLVVSHPDFAMREVATRVERTGRADRPMELAPVDLEEGGSIEGDVVDAAGRPVAGARVAVGVAPAYLPLGSTPTGSVMTDVSGHFRLTGIAPGSVELTAVAAAAGRGSARGVRVEAARTTERVRIQLAPGAEPEEPTATGNVAVTLSERAAAEIVVAHVPEGSEAERSGIAVGDRILAIDGERPGSMRRARALLAGPPGSDVVIDLDHQGQHKSVRVTREVVRR
jgi:hypothetical protein